MEQAVIDRFEGGLAVLLVGEAERKVIVERKLLPTGVREGDWLQVILKGEKLLQATVDTEARASAEARIADKLERLRRGEQLNGQ